MKWTSASAIGVAGLQFVQVALLAHLLSARDFGLMASVTVVLGFASGLSGIGIGNAIIARQTTSRETLSTLYWVDVLGGLATAGVLLATIPLIVSFFRQPALAHLLRWTSLSFVIVPLGRQFQILLEKELHFARVARIEITAAVAALVVSVTSAATGAGAIALVWGGVANTATRSFLLVGLTDWRPSLHLRWRDLDGYIGFGLFQMGEQSVNYLAANVDYLIVGRFLGAGTLGAYALAYQLIAKPLTTINPVLTRVAFPVFAKIRNDFAAVRRGFLELTHLIALVAFPIMIGLAVAAPTFVPVIFGSHWSTTASLVPVLAVVGLLKMIANPIGSVILAKGRADLGFAVNVVVLIGLGGSLLAVVHLGVMAVAFAYVVVCVVMFVMERAILHRLVGFSFTSDVRALAGPAAMTCVMGLVMGVTYVGVYAPTRSAPITLIAQTLAGVLTYVLLVAKHERSYLHELWSHVRPRPVPAQPGPEPGVQSADLLLAEDTASR